MTPLRWGVSKEGGMKQRRRMITNRKRRKWRVRRGPGGVFWGLEMSPILGLTRQHTLSLKWFPSESLSYMDGRPEETTLYTTLFSLKHPSLLVTFISSSHEAYTQPKAEKSATKKPWQARPSSVLVRPSTPPSSSASSSSTPPSPSPGPPSATPAWPFSCPLCLFTLLSSMAETNVSRWDQRGVGQGLCSLEDAYSDSPYLPPTYLSSRARHCQLFPPPSPSISRAMQYEYAHVKLAAVSMPRSLSRTGHHLHTLNSFSLTHHGIRQHGVKFGRQRNPRRYPFHRLASKRLAVCSAGLPASLPPLSLLFQARNTAKRGSASSRRCCFRPVPVM
ncbi:hypothetical protein LZ31DRAFT_37413 [Colletotrichum somersetense]|nr:hypothetical protein LZ31DRAFT_37413 [Colletotrichum somersetense]